jgi:hypothetical protein
VIEMRLEMMRTFPVSRQQAWDYTNDFHTWPEWYGGKLVEPEKSCFDEPGDTVRVADPLLGSLYTGSLTLEEKVVPEMTRTLYRWPGWPDFHVEIHFTEAGSGACTVRMVAYVDEEAGPVGKSIGRLMVTLPVMMKRQVRRMFDRLDVLFRTRLSEKEEAKKPAPRTKVSA